MNINDDFSNPASAHPETMQWVASPMAGVDRKMLDRIGEEVARATSIVRYAPGSHFSEHTHSGGEEFIVLDGTFQDEHGDYPAGTYVRNPIGTRHVPRSDKGCTIFVKLWQFAADDQRQCAIDLGNLELDAVTEAPGVERAIIHQHPSETVAIECWARNAVRTLGNPHGAELLILDGTLEWKGESYARHGWLRLPGGEDAQLKAGADGVRIWIKTGHLAHVSAPPA